MKRFPRIGPPITDEGVADVVARFDDAAAATITFVAQQTGQYLITFGGSPLRLASSLTAITAAVTIQISDDATTLFSETATSLPSLGGTVTVSPISDVISLVKGVTYTITQLLGAFTSHITGTWLLVVLRPIKL